MINVKKFEEAKSKILDRIRQSNYPKDHPFLDPRFENDYYHQAFSFFLYQTNSEEIIFDLIDKKLNGRQAGKFDFYRLHEGISEFNVLYYLFWGALENEYNHINFTEIHYEPENKENKKTLEFVFETIWNNQKKHVAVEVKAITTAPESKEDEQLPFGKKYVKPFFKNISLEHLKERDDYDDLIFLTSSSHSRQIAKRVKGINEKFKKHPEMLNLGFLIFQYATSMEEIFAYLFHPEHGVYTKQPDSFSELDAVVVFSLTQAPDFKMQELYDRTHVITMCLTKEAWKLETLSALRLDKYMYFADEVQDWVEPYIYDDHGVFNYEVVENILYFVNEKNVEEARQKAKDIAPRLNSPKPNPVNIVVE